MLTGRYRRRVRNPLLKSTMSGTWAKTLLATTRSGPPMSGGYIHANLLAEKHHLRLDTSAARDLSHVGGWLDTEGPNTTGHGVLQKVAVVAGNLDYERPRAEIQRAGGVLANRPACATQESEYEEKYA